VPVPRHHFYFVLLRFSEIICWICMRSTGSRT
jgi:hypothetical protein